MGNVISGVGFRLFRPRLPGPGHQPLDGIFCLKFLLETRLQSESFEPSIGFLVCLVEKSWPKITILGKNALGCFYPRFSGKVLFFATVFVKQLRLWICCVFNGNCKVHSACKALTRVWFFLFFFVLKSLPWYSNFFLSLIEFICGLSFMWRFGDAIAII